MQLSLVCWYANVDEVDQESEVLEGERCRWLPMPPRFLSADLGLV